jgi:hypothetical protein
MFTHTVITHTPPHTHAHSITHSHLCYVSLIIVAHHLCCVLHNLQEAMKIVKSEVDQRLAKGVPEETPTKGLPKETPSTTPSTTPKVNLHNS